MFYHSKNKQAKKEIEDDTTCPEEESKARE